MTLFCPKFKSNFVIKSTLINNYIIYLTIKMSISEIRIGQYRFSKNLGNGSFGKVKSKYPPVI